MSTIGAIELTKAGFDLERGVNSIALVFGKEGLTIETIKPKGIEQ